jgi:4-hydroxybenzoate polyprenyltransferase
MNSWRSYIRLARLDRPVGSLLLWFPTAWALWLANAGPPPLSLLMLFFIGTIVMRSAGCVINDFADRNLDRFVKRTQDRPLTSGKVQIWEAFVLLGIFLIAALFILMRLPSVCYPWAVLALFLSLFYPFCKRFFAAPQLVLGLAYSMGIPMAYLASGVSLNLETLFLFVMNFLWIMAYDTIYAMVDKADDLKIGIKSTAILFGDYDHVFVAFFHLLLHTLWWLWAWTHHAALGFYLCWSLAGIILCVQQRLIRGRVESHCFTAFRFSLCYGALMWLAL